MTLLRTLLTALAAATLMAATADRADAQVYQHLDQLALRMQGEARTLYSEVRLHYSHTSAYPHLRSDVIQLYRAAAHVHEVAHHRGSLHHLRSDLAKMDRLLHHVQRLVDSIDFHTSHGHGGHTHGAAYHVRQVLNRMESLLHHMRRDVASLTSPPIHHGGGMHGGGFHGGIGHGVHWHGNGVHVGVGRGHHGTTLVIGGRGFGLRIGR